MSEYRAHLMDTIVSLEAVRNQLFDNVINVGMHGVHADINKVFEAGDNYEFELEHFDDTDDPNLQELVNLVRHIDSTSRKLLRVNRMNMKEIDF